MVCQFSADISIDNYQDARKLPRENMTDLIYDAASSEGPTKARHVDCFR